MCRSDIHFISCASATISPDPHARMYACASTHTQTRLTTPPTFTPPSGGQEVWERESDWLSGLTFVSQLPVN